MALAVTEVVAVWPAPRLEAKAAAAIELDALWSQRAVEGPWRVGDLVIGPQAPVPVDRQMSAPTG